MKKYIWSEASTKWNEKFTNYLKSLHFKDTDDAPCLFYNKSRSVLIALFVDDGLIIEKDKNEVNEILSKLARKYEVTCESPKQGKLYYLGMEINLTKNGIFVSQSEYTKKILEKFGFADAYLVSTPMEPG